MLDDEVLGTKDLEQFSKSADELTRKLLEITNQVDKLQTSLNGVNSSFRNIGKNATKYTNEAYVKKVVDDYEKATRKEEERINKETRKKEETKLKKDQHNTIKSIGKIGSTITTVVGSVTAAVATFSKVMKEAVSGISDARWSNSTAAIVEFGKKTEETTIKAKNAFSNILSWIGNGLGIIGNALGSILKKIPGISNIADAMNEDQLEKTLATYKGQAQQNLLGSGASGKLTTKIADFIVSAALSSARKIGGYSSDLSDADVMDTSTYETFFSMYSKLVSEPKSTWFTGYKAMKKGYGFAMTDLSPEENMALMAEAIDELKNLSVEEYNDTIKRWTKMGRIIEKFGKNLYAFDEVLSNDPFSNEDVENIDRTTGDIEDQLNDMQETTTAEIGTVADNIGNLEDEIQTTNDAINTTNNDVTNIKENVKNIVDWLNKLKLNINITLPSQDDQYDVSTDITTIINKLDDIVNFYNGLKITESDNIIIYKPSAPSTPDNPPEEPSNVVAPEGKQRALDALSKHLDFMSNLIDLYTEYMDDANDYSEGALENKKSFVFRKNTVLGLIDDINSGVYDSSSTAQWTDFINGIISYETDIYKNRSEMMPMEGILEFAALLENLYDSFGIEPITHSGGGHRFANGGLATKKMPTLSTLFEEGPEMVLPLNAAGADFLATSLNNLGLSNRLTNNSANVNVNLSGINIADNDREWYEVAHKIHNIIEAEQARQGG